MLKNPRKPYWEMAETEVLMTYEQALNQCQKVGASKAKGLPLLAMTCEALSSAHAINPKLAYDGARKLNLDARAVRKLDPVALGDLMFVV